LKYYPLHKQPVNMVTPDPLQTFAPTKPPN